MGKYKNAYRIESARMRNWDYSWAALYFVTICVKDRICSFGEIVEGKMKLSAIGKIAKQEWLKTFEMRPDMNLTMGEFVVMPNHFHAIIGIGKNEYNTRDGQRRDAMHCVSTLPTTSTTNTTDNLRNAPKNQFGPQSKNLASIIRGFKIGVTKNGRIIDPDFAWQSRFHDHIIRDNDSFERIYQYIQNNPTQWQKDSFYPQKHNRINESRLD